MRSTSRRPRPWRTRCPGRVTHMWFQFNETGEFQAFCREYCGTAHAFMLATIKVVSEEEFDSYLEG